MHAQFGGQFAHQIGIAGLGVGGIVRVMDQAQAQSLCVTVAAFQRGLGIALDR